jgi:hypothetical protein
MGIYFPPSYFPGGPQAGGITPPPPPAGGAPNDRAILHLIRDILDGTGQFDLVVTTGPPEERGQSAEYSAAAFLELFGPGTDEQQGNDSSRHPWKHTRRFRATIAARAEDPDERDDLCDALCQAAAQAIDGRCIGGWTYPWETGIEQWQDAPATAPERRIVLTGKFAYGRKPDSAQGA